MLQAVVVEDTVIEPLTSGALITSGEHFCSCGKELKYQSHGYRWLNAKIRLDTWLKVSDLYAYKCCKLAGIKSR